MSDEQGGARGRAAVRRPPTGPLVPGRLRRVVWTGSDRLLAAAAHAAIAFGLLGIGFLASLAISGVIWVISRHSPHVARHAEQAGAYQLFVLIANVLVVIAWAALSVALFGRVVLFPPSDASGIEQTLAPVAMLLWLLAVPLFALWYVGSIALGVIGAVRVLLGYEFWYPVFGRWAWRKHGG